MGDIYGWDIWYDDDDPPHEVLKWNVSMITKWGSSWIAGFARKEDAEAYVAWREGSSG